MSPNPISLAIALGRLLVPGALLIAPAVMVLVSLKVARQWEEAIVRSSCRAARSTA